MDATSKLNQSVYKQIYYNWKDYVSRHTSDSTDMMHIKLALDACDENIAAFATQCGVPYTKEANEFVWYDSNAVDLIGGLFQNQDAKLHLYNWVSATTPMVPSCKVALMDDRAVMPFKTRESDVGYDLTVIGLHKKLNDTVSLYKTGVKLQVDSGWYTEIVPRSSLSKSGYMLTNSIGIIDNSYTGELLVALTKVDSNAAPIEFPFRGVQMIFRRQNYALFKQVSETEIGATARGEGGFGSTN